jgi:hypothetical protein
LTVTDTSNQASSDPGHPQIVITPTWSGGFGVKVLAEYSGCTPRVYSFAATATDLAGNAASATAACTVPASQGGTPTSMTPVSGYDQWGYPGARLATPLVVKVVDACGAPVPGVTVTFTAGNAAVTPAATTDGNGMASTQVTLGGIVGPAVITATVGSISTTFSFSVASQGGHGTPAPVSVMPPSGATASPTLAFTFADSAGYQDLGVVNILLNNFLDGRHACYIAYSRLANSLFLVDDAGDAGGPFAGSRVLSGSGSMQNGQCTVSWTDSAVSLAGNNLTLTLTLAFSPGFGGNKVVYMAARNLADSNPGWTARGVWLVPGAAQTTTTAVSGMDPARGAGAGLTAYTFAFSDTQGFGDLGVENILVNDAGIALSPGKSLATPGSIQNGQCTATWGTSPVVASGNSLDLSLNISFSSGFGPDLTFYMAVRDTQESNNSGWQPMGTWTVR